MSQTADGSEPQDRHGHGAVGTWRLMIKPPAPFNVFKAIIAFTSDGIVHQTVANSVESALGVWEPDGENQFRVTLYVLRHNTAAQLEVVLRVRADFTLADHDTLTATATVDFLNPENEDINIRPSEHDTVTGSRMAVMAQ